MRPHTGHTGPIDSREQEINLRRHRQRVRKMKSTRHLNSFMRVGFDHNTPTERPHVVRFG
jgi:hypothetical protein